MTVEPFKAVGVDGREGTISYGASEKPTVFYVLTPSCVWCERNQANLNKLIELRGKDYRFIGLSLAEPGLKEYLEKHHFSFPMYTGLRPETINALGLGSTPQTIVVSPEGRVLRNWTGAYAEPVLPEVEEYFQMRFPGLTPASH